MVAMSWMDWWTDTAKPFGVYDRSDAAKGIQQFSSRMKRSFSLGHKDC